MSRKGRYLFTSESVTEGHPDKIADQISDSILDAILAQDPAGRVACETLVTTGLAIVAGEITTSCYVDFQKIVRETIKEVGYTRASVRLRLRDLRRAVVDSRPVARHRDGRRPRRRRRPGPDVRLRLHRDRRADAAADHAGAQAREGACPARRRDGVLDYLRPDGKSQVSIEYDNGRPVRVDTVVVSTQHSADVSQRDAARRHHREDHQPRHPRGDDGQEDASTSSIPTGRFVVGGPHGDAGVTGRKIIVDTYGGAAPHGGGAFSGKDPTKVDRSACYMARYVAKNVVAAGLAERCLVQLAYAIGVAEPVSVLVDTFGTGTVDDEKISELVRRALQADAARHHRNARPAPADLQEDRGVRALRPHRAGVHLGADRQGGRASRGRRPLIVRAAGPGGDWSLKSLADGGPRGRRCLFSSVLPPRAAARPPAADPRRSATHAPARFTSTAPGPTARATAMQSRARPRAPGCSSSSSPITATARGRPSRRNIFTACCASTASRSARTAGTTSRWAAASRRIRSAATRPRSWRTSPGSAGSASPRTRSRPSASWRWTDWAVPLDGIEWLNADSEWRDERRAALARALLGYLTRPAGRSRRCSIVRSQRWPSGTLSTQRRRFVALPATTRTADSARRTATARPSPASPVLRGHVPDVLGARVLGAPPSGAPAAMPRSCSMLYGTGSVFTAVDAIAGPGALDFRAAAAARSSRWGRCCRTRRDGDVHCARGRSGAGDDGRCSGTARWSPSVPAECSNTRGASRAATGSKFMSRRTRDAAGSVAGQQSDLLVPPGVRRAASRA